MSSKRQSEKNSISPLKKKLQAQRSPTSSKSTPSRDKFSKSPTSTDTGTNKEKKKNLRFIKTDCDLEDSSSGLQTPWTPLPSLYSSTKSRKTPTIFDYAKRSSHIVTSSKSGSVAQTPSQKILQEARTSETGFFSLQDSETGKQTDTAAGDEKTSGYRIKEFVALKDTETGENMDEKQSHGADGNEKNSGDRSKRGEQHLPAAQRRSKRSHSSQARSSSANRRLSASKAIRSGDIETLTSSGVLPPIPKEFEGSHSQVKSLTNVSTSSIASKQNEVLGRLRAQQLAEDYLNSLKGSKLKMHTHQRNRRGSASQHMLEMKYGEGDFDDEELDMPDYALNLDIDRRRKSTTSSVGSTEKSYGKRGTGIARSLLERYAGKFADDDEEENRRQKMISELEEYENFGEDEESKRETANLEKLKNDLEQRRRRKTSITTALAGARILYGSLIALESPTGGFLCLRKPPKQMQVRTDDTNEERRTSIGSNTTTRNEYKLSEVESFVTLDAPKPAKKVPNQYTTFRVTNADWPGDEGRIKAGDRICLQIANNWVLGSKLTAGRSEYAKTYVSRIDKLLKSVEEYRAKVMNSMPTGEPPNVASIVAALEKEVFENEHFTDQESDELSNFLRALADPSKWPTLTDDIEGSTVILQAIDELQAAVNLHYAEDADTGGNTEASALKRKFLEEYHSIQAKRNKLQVKEPEGGNATWRPSALPVQPATQQTRKYLYNWTLKIHASAKAGTAEAAADEQHENERSSSNTKEQSSDHWLDSMVGSESLLSNGSFISLNQDFGHLVVAEPRGLDAEVKTEPNAATLRERETMEQKIQKEQKHHEYAEALKMKSMFDDHHKEASLSPDSENSNEQVEVYQKKRGTDGFSSDAVAVCDLPENLKCSSGVGAQGIVNGKHVTGQRQMLSERVAKVFGLEQQQHFSSYLAGERRLGDAREEQENMEFMSKSSERLGKLSRRVRINEGKKNNLSKWRVNPSEKQEKGKTTGNSHGDDSKTGDRYAQDDGTTHCDMLKSLTISLTGRENMFTEPRVSIAGMWRVHLCSSTSGNATLQKSSSAKVTTAKTGSSDDGTSHEGTSRTEQETQQEGMATELEKRGAATMIRNSWSSFSPTAAFAMLMNIASTQLGFMQKRGWLERCSKLVKDYPRFRKELRARQPWLLSAIQRKNHDVFERVKRGYEERVIGTLSPSSKQRFDFKGTKSLQKSDFAYALDPQNNLSNYQRTIFESDAEVKASSLKATVTPAVWSRMNTRQVYLQLSKLSGGSKLEAAVVALQRAYREKTTRKWARMFFKYDKEIEYKLTEESAKGGKWGFATLDSDLDTHFDQSSRGKRSKDESSSAMGTRITEGAYSQNSRSEISFQKQDAGGKYKSQIYENAQENSFYSPTATEGVVVGKRRKPFGYRQKFTGSEDNVARKSQENVHLNVEEAKKATKMSDTQQLPEQDDEEKRSSARQYMSKWGKSLEYVEATKSRRASMSSEPGDIVNAMELVEHEEKEKEAGQVRGTVRKLHLEDSNFQGDDDGHSISSDSSSKSSSGSICSFPDSSGLSTKAMDMKEKTFSVTSRQSSAPVGSLRPSPSVKPKRKAHHGAGRVTNAETLQWLPMQVDDVSNPSLKTMTKNRRTACLETAKQHYVGPGTVKPPAPQEPASPVEKMLNKIQGTYFEALEDYEEKAKTKEDDDDEEESNPGFVELKRSLSSLSSFGDEKEDERRSRLSVDRFKKYLSTSTLRKRRPTNNQTHTASVRLSQIKDDRLRRSLAFLSKTRPQLFRDTSAERMLERLYDKSY